MSGRRGLRPGQVVLAGLGLVLAVAAFLGVTALVTLVATSIWPGQAGATARWFCDADHPDHLVVATSYQTGEGTTTDTTLYCIGPRGDAVDVGWGRSWLVLWAGYSVATAVVVGLVAVWVGRKRAGRRGPPGHDRRPGGNLRP